MALRFRVRRLDQLDGEQHDVGVTVATLSAELTALERRALGGEKISETARGKVESATRGGACGAERTVA